MEFGTYISEKKRMWQVAGWNAVLAQGTLNARGGIEIFFYFNNIYCLTPPLYGDMKPHGFFAST